MKIVEMSTGEEFSIEILPVEQNEFKTLTKDRFFFDWETERGQEVYKLKIVEMNDILGLVSCERIPTEWRIHIRLLSVSIENKGTSKKYDRIIGNLITNTAKVALREFGELTCVSLRPKSQIAQHYIDTYGMNKTGMTLSIELTEILNLLKKYDHDGK